MRNRGKRTGCRTQCVDDDNRSGHGRNYPSAEGKAPNVKIMVGGAVLTEEYAAAIGADAYCKDAMASVNFAILCE